MHEAALLTAPELRYGKPDPALNIKHLSFYIDCL